MDTPTLLETSRLCSEPGGLLKIQKGLAIALAGARRDVELECGEVVAEDNSRWWCTQSGLFLGENDGDREFRALLMESVAYLEMFGQIERHPTYSHWIRFKVVKP